MVRASTLTALLAAACLPDNPGDDGAGTGNGTGEDTAGSSDGGGDGGAGGEVLGCPAGASCRLILVSQTLDDRVEIFDADGPTYRGAIDVDLEPNTCAGCGLGDYADGRLDEPFGLARAGGFLHLAVGHYPARDSGTLVSFPLAMFAGMPAGSTLAVADYFTGGVFSAPVVANSLEQVEPIFVTARGSRLLIGTFNNDLFASETSWTQPGLLLVLDAADPSAAPAVVDLGAVGCNGASQVVELSPTTVGVACDGNEGVAVLDVSALDSGSVSEAAGAITGTLCPIPGAVDPLRVRYLAPDGSGGFVVGEGPTPENILAAARLWYFDGSCGMNGLGQLPADGDWQLGELEAFPGTSPTWLLAAGSATAESPSRGVHVIVADGGSLQVCNTIAGFDAAWQTDDGPLNPVGLAVASDGSGIAVGAGPFQAPMAGPGYGRVLWGALDGFDDPCTMTATVTDLTDGTFAPAVDPMNAATFRRAPNVVEIVEISG